MLQQFTVVDADGHITDTDDSLSRYLDEPFSSRRRPYFHRDNWDRPLRGRWGTSARDAETWSKAMETEGIDMSILFPTAGLGFGLVREADFATALSQAYNNFVHDRFMKQDPRLIGIALLPLQNITEAVRELNRVVTKLGMPGAMLPAYGLRKLLGAQEYWPIYEEAQRLNVALAVHAGPRGSHQFGTDLFDSFMEVHAISHPFGQIAQLTSLLCSGVPEKFPRLRLGFLEAGCGWVPYWMERLDEEYEKRAEEVPLLKSKPGDYMRNGQLFYSCECEEGMLPYVLERMGENVILYASDFPHWDSNYPHSAKTIAERRDLSRIQKQKVLGENARRFYNLGA